MVSVRGRTPAVGLRGVGRVSPGRPIRTGEAGMCLLRVAPCGFLALGTIHGQFKRGQGSLPQQFKARVGSRARCSRSGGRVHAMCIHSLALRSVYIYSNLGLDRAEFTVALFAINAILCLVLLVCLVFAADLEAADCAIGHVR